MRRILLLWVIMVSLSHVLAYNDPKHQNGNCDPGDPTNTFLNLGKVNPLPPPKNTDALKQPVSKKDSKRSSSENTVINMLSISTILPNHPANTKRTENKNQQLKKSGEKEIPIFIRFASARAHKNLSRFFAIWGKNMLELLWELPHNNETHNFTDDINPTNDNALQDEAIERSFCNTI